MAGNPIIGLARLAKALDLEDLVDLFHATPMAGAMQGARANPALSMGANQGRGVYGYVNKNQALDHLAKLIKGDLMHAGGRTGIVPKKFADRPDAGVIKMTVPKKSLRFDVTSLDKTPDKAKDLLGQNEAVLNELLKSIDFRIRGSGPRNERISDIMVGPDAVRVRRRYADKRGSHSRTVSFDEPATGDEEVFGPIFDLVRNIDRAGYDELLEELLGISGSAFRTLASPRGIRVA